MLFYIIASYTSHNLFIVISYYYTLFLFKRFVPLYLAFMVKYVDVSMN